MIENNRKISYVGYEHVDHDTVSDAIAGQTLFIHGSRVDEGSGASITATAAAKKSKKRTTKAEAGGGGAVLKTKRRLRRWRRLESADEGSSGCSGSCGSGKDTTGLPDGTSTVCDPTCGSSDADSRFGGFLCGAGDSALFGDMCRLCYVCPRAARNAQLALRSSFDGGAGNEERAVIMCDTMEPPPPPPESAAVDAAGCSDKCNQKKDTVSHIILVL